MRTRNWKCEWSELWHCYFVRIFSSDGSKGLYRVHVAQSRPTQLCVVLTGSIMGNFTNQNDRYNWFHSSRSYLPTHLGSCHTDCAVAQTDSKDKANERIYIFLEADRTTNNGVDATFFVRFESWYLWTCLIQQCRCRWWERTVSSVLSSSRLYVPTEIESVSRFQIQ